MFYKKAYTEVPAIISFNSLLKELHTKTVYFKKKNETWLKMLFFFQPRPFYLLEACRSLIVHMRRWELEVIITLQREAYYMSWRTPRKGIT